MYRSALRSSPRIANSLRQSAAVKAAGGRRFASTTPANKSRSWKSSALRWGIAVGAVYYYNTSNAFAEEPVSKTIEPPAQFSDEDLPTVEAVVAQKRREAEARLQKAVSPATPTPDPALSDTTAPTAPAQDVTTGAQELPPTGATTTTAAEGSPEALEEEAGQQGAFNPETGEINWDCPCLGGMAHGPCGEEFKAAFSCFVYSNEEPKGMDCIDKFQHMQDCFRLHPEVYGEELNDDEEAEAQAPLDDAPEAAAATPAQQAPAETARARPAADERRNASEGRKPSARDAKKSKVPTGSELPEEVKDTASPE
ncbi:putative mitochondrial intermembrane space protein mia40 protein [Eutypa lata UCREL1]|uniref:Mitochondrial intermembrane space import and assembly protein 40 n=1 Tax=Eutypa lata (strain UCR-EL1) TaxID=1287681 RepID=M7TJT3_EUTLA|nr:putative mitochondrial intermembrane space protein mia40 protein [Eutypa lata UCREL1]